MDTFLKSLSRIRLSELAALLIGFLYVNGYYVNSIFIRNLGITHAELIKLEYINIGFTFTLITTAFTVLPIGIFYFTYNVRKKSGLPNYHVGAIGNSLNTTLFLIFPLFLALFATRYEWDYTFYKPILNFTNFKSVAITCIALSSIGTVLVPVIERIVDKIILSKWKSKVFNYAIEPLRFGVFAITLVLIIWSLSQIPWVGNLFSRGLYYFLAGIVFVFGFVAAILWIKHIKDTPKIWLVYCLIAFGIASLYYLTVTSYVFGVYNFIPYNRGGRLPLTEAYIKTKKEEKVQLAPETSINNIEVEGPVYIIEENEDSWFVASEGMENWINGFVNIHVIRKENVTYIRLERIKNGFPRIIEPIVIQQPVQ